ncbi:MAG: transposase [Oleiphilus sp.]|nr:MAG: transposase [Oleiphilus sp.]
MTLPRSALVSVEDTPYYHVVTRCVRRTFLCGVDRETGQSFEHRRQWIEDRIRLLSSLFAVDICAYAVMSNHVHMVLKLCPEEAKQWSDQELMERWACLYKGPPLFQKAQSGQALQPHELTLLSDLRDIYRDRLGSLSWFMKCLNEPIARMANQEDNCTGHFWEARFKSQALLTEEALLSCMAYVDLNPVRAGMAETPEESDHTSIQERLNPRCSLALAMSEQGENKGLRHSPDKLKPLAQFEGNDTDHHLNGILFSLQDYLELVDTTGRILRDDKRGAIPLHLPPILERLGTDRKTWLVQCTQFEKLYQKRFAKRPRRVDRQSA